VADDLLLVEDAQKLKTGSATCGTRTWYDRPRASGSTWLYDLADRAASIWSAELPSGPFYFDETDSKYGGIDAPERST
jgi:hypothetical protein